MDLFVFLLFSLSSLHNLDTSPLSDVSFANIFSHLLACVLFLLTVSFAEQAFLILMKSILPIFFIDCAFVFAKSLQNTLSSRFSPMLPSRSFIVLCFIVISVIDYVSRSTSRLSILLLFVSYFANILS